MVSMKITGKTVRLALYIIGIILLMISAYYFENLSFRRFYIGLSIIFLIAFFIDWSIPQKDPKDELIDSDLLD